MASHNGKNVSMKQTNTPKWIHLDQEDRQHQYHWDPTHDQEHPQVGWSSAVPVQHVCDVCITYKNHNNDLLQLQLQPYYNTRTPVAQPGIGSVFCVCDRVCKITSLGIHDCIHHKNNATYMYVTVNYTRCTIICLH